MTSEFISDDEYRQRCPIDYAAQQSKKTGWDGRTASESKYSLPVCVLTGAQGEDADDCTTHEHE